MKPVGYTDAYDALERARNAMHGREYHPDYAKLVDSLNRASKMLGEEQTNECKQTADGVYGRLSTIPYQEPVVEEVAATVVEAAAPEPEPVSPTRPGDPTLRVGCRFRPIRGAT